MGLQYGFRHDPMPFIEESDSLQAVLIHRHVFHTPKPGDEAILTARIDEILAGQREDGLLDDRGHGHASALMELADCGVDPARPEVRKAIETTLEGDPENDGEIWIRDIRGLYMLGVTDHPKLTAAIQTALDSEKDWSGPYKLCLWGPNFYLRVLWGGARHCRHDGRLQAGPELDDRRTERRWVRGR
jgi:hypothetical protein